MNKLCKYNQNHIDLKDDIRPLFTELFAFTTFRVGVNEGKKYTWTDSQPIYSQYLRLKFE